MRDSGNGARILIGILLIVIGAVFLLETLDVFGDGVEIFRDYWPVLLIGWGVWAWWQQGFRFALVPVAAVAVGGLLLAGNLTDINAWQFWPVIIILIGLSLLYRRSRPAQASGGATVRSDGAVNINAILGGGDTRISNEFRGGQITALMGGGTLDLRDATLPPSGATVDVSILFGGYELKIPPDWQVNLKTTNLFGGSTDERRRADGATGGGSLTVTGSVLFGGLDVK